MRAQSMQRTLLSQLPRLAGWTPAGPHLRFSKACLAHRSHCFRCRAAALWTAALAFVGVPGHAEEGWAVPSEARVSALPSAGRPPAETEAGPRLPSAPGLVFRLLLLCVAATGKCSGKHHELLLQLQRQADLMQNPSTLLDPYVQLQGLHSPVLKGSCMERLGDFPSEDALWSLSRQDFLRTLNTTLGLFLRMLSAFQQDLPKAAHQQAEMNIRGLGNNIHCMAQLLRGPSDPEAAEPTQPGPGPTSPPPPLPTLPTLPSDTFKRKLRICEFLQGYHRFMSRAGQVLRGWGERQGRNRRHSPLRGLQSTARRTRPFPGLRRLVPQGQLPR